MDTDMAIMIGAFAIGLLVTLVLSAFLTPAGWWKRPNARALAILVVGTWGIGSMLLWLAPKPVMAATPAVAGIAAISPSVERSYHVFEDLNLRAGSSIGARRVTVVPVGATVTATGAREGDWWEVRTKVGGKQVKGWVSSLWLRRAEEAH